MKNAINICLSLVAIPFAIIGGILFGLFRLIITPIDLLSVVLCDIWERE